MKPAATQTRTTFTVAELDTLRKDFAVLQTVDPDNLPRFHKLFAECSGDALQQLAGANIKFLSKLAVNACLRRGVALPA